MDSPGRRAPAQATLKGCLYKSTRAPEHTGHLSTPGTRTAQATLKGCLYMILPGHLGTWAFG